MATTSPTDIRFLSLDLIRGVGVMGILLMNIVAFGMPFQAYSNPMAYGGSSPLDLAVWATNFVLVDSKMRGLFSVLFGASMLLVVERAEVKGENPALTHYSRMTWLLLFGAVHAWAIWFGDILMLYAVTGMIAFFLRGLSAHKLVVLGLILMFVQAVFMGLLGLSIWFLREAATAPGADGALVEQWQAMQTQFGALPPDELARDLALFRSGYLTILSERLGPLFWWPIKGNFPFIPETLGLMLIGMAGYKSGFLTGQWERAAYLRFVRIGYLIGLPLLGALAIWLMMNGFDPVAMVLVNFSVQHLVNPLVILAHASLIIYWLQSDAGSALVQRIAATGRAAFSNYLGTSIVCTTIFYGYGFGLYGELSRAALYLVVLGVWILMLLWSKPWLDRFRYGPLEWLWRSLARRRIQPLRK
ncbi:MAG: DUF418 domain-containing protein [Sphingomonadaceae bacterium]|nr:DUF418 domain-containing protein [Sphingomonadaceae bacterium]